MQAHHDSVQTLTSLDWVFREAVDRDDPLVLRIVHHKAQSLATSYPDTAEACKARQLVRRIDVLLWCYEIQGDLDLARFAGERPKLVERLQSGRPSGGGLAAAMRLYGELMSLDREVTDANV